jgi:hypothetical protein
LGDVLKFVALAVAVSIAGPSYSGSVDDRQIERLAEREERSQTQALSTLVRRHWVEGEARERGIVETESRAELRHDLLWVAIRTQIAEPAAKSVTPDQVRAYVDANPQVIPETRTVWLVETSSRRRAEAALKKLRRGATWSSVNGRRWAVTRADKTALGRAVFRARLNRTIRYGRAVFRVSKHTPERPEPRAQQEARAWEVLASEAQQRALDEFEGQFTAKWRQRTACAPEYVRHEDCGQPPSGQATP